MKKLIYSTLFALITHFGFTQSTGSIQDNFQTLEEISISSPELLVIYQEFLQNQNEPFKNANSETFKFNETNWCRPFNESKYCLTPVMDNVDDYISRISEGNGVFKFVEVQLSNSSIELLKSININVPNYVKNFVICYLPSFDIDFLVQNQINLTELTSYGNQMHLFSKDEEQSNFSKALIWSEGFETNAVPGSSYNASNGATNCGWKDVNCYAKSGDWSVWCAGNGAACNNCLENYVNDMSTAFSPKYYTNVSGYEDIVFRYWIDLDLNNTGTNDQLLRFDDLGSGSWSLGATFTSASSIDGQLWNQKSVSYAGQAFTQYGFRFSFTSNFTGTSYGVYLDDLQLTGNSTADLTEIEAINSVSIYPNPSDGIFNLELNKNLGESIDVSIFNLSGQLVYTKQFSLDEEDQINTIDLKELEKGVYTVQVISEKGNINRKLVIE